MPADFIHVNFESYFKSFISKSNKRIAIASFTILTFFFILGLFTQLVPSLSLGLVFMIIFVVILLLDTRQYHKKLAFINQKFPIDWQHYLEAHSLYYKHLDEEEKKIFNQRIQLFLGEKRIVGVETEVEDELKILIAASAIIPTFAFPYFEYPNIKEIVVYPRSFDENFQTLHDEESPGKILGMVGNKFLNNTMLLSKPALLDGFNGQYDKSNVGIHEFVHLLDMADGVTDGLPEIFLSHTYTLPWLHVIKEETKKIKLGHSDINPYGLTNNAEFLAVISEYFFDNPAKFHKRHPELYSLLCTIYHQDAATGKTFFAKNTRK